MGFTSEIPNSSWSSGGSLKSRVSSTFAAAGVKATPSPPSVAAEVMVAAAVAAAALAASAAA